MGARINRGGDQHGFTREGDAGALNGHEQEDCQIAIGGDEVRVDAGKRNAASIVLLGDSVRYM